ncbi:MAG: PorV/PorQ family protein [Elusimicrobia bacterium]|nr:PorV/PorQ family protein [Elusimicrobiota bacterium]
MKKPFNHLFAQSLTRLLSIFFLTCILAYSLTCYLNAFASAADRGTAGAQFLKIGAGARAVGMGEAFSGIANDVTSIYWNPAGLVQLEQPAFEAMYLDWFQGMHYQFLAFAYPTEIGTLGLSLSGFDVDDIEKRDEDTADPISEFGATDMAYTVAYSKKVMEDVSAGFSIKIIRQELDTYDAQAFASDIGFLYNAPIERLTAGLVVQNFGSRVKFISDPDPLPLTIKLGLGYKLFSDKLTIGADAAAPRDNKPYASGGCEYASRIISDLSGSVRAGYKTGMEIGRLDGLAVGAGLGYRNFNLNCAWVPYGDLGNTFRYSLAVKF